MWLTLRENVNWRRVWLAVLVGYILLVVASNLILGYVASYHPQLIDWQENPPISEVTLYGK